MARRSGRQAEGRILGVGSSGASSEIAAAGSEPVRAGGVA